MSKRKRSSSMSAPEMKQIRKQIEELEKMYFEILRIIDPDKQSNYSRTSAQSSTSLSSYSNVSSNKDTSKRNSQHRSRQKQQQRSSMQQRSFSSQPNQNQSSSGSDMKSAFLF
jgi:septin family protein